MLVIREAQASDAPLLVEMIRELADFERELDQVNTTADDLVRDGFVEGPKFHSFIAEWECQPAGYVFYFFTYSTWAGRPSLFVEDLFVRPGFRGKGIGTALLKRLAAIAHEKNCYGMRWEVLSWNNAAIEFYRSLGATLDSQWLPVLLMGSAFQNLTSREV